MSKESFENKLTATTHSHHADDEHSHEAASDVFPLPTNTASSDTMPLNSSLNSSVAGMHESKEQERFGGKAVFVKPTGRILLVDDEPLVLEILELAFRQSGFEVVTSNTSQAALKHIDKSHFDGLISDVRLEHIDGFDLLALARRHNPDLIAVLITGATTKSTPVELQTCARTI